MKPANNSRNEIPGKSSPSIEHRLRTGHDDFSRFQTLRLETKTIIWIARILILMFLISKCLSSGRNRDEDGIDHETIFYLASRFHKNPKSRTGKTTSNQITHFILSLEWPLVLERTDRNILWPKVREHLLSKQIPDSFTIHGLWAADQRNRLNKFCGDFNANLQRFEEIQHNLLGESLMAKHWPALSASNRLTTWFNVWVRKGFSLFD